MSLARIGEWLVSLGPGTRQPVANLEALAQPYLRTINDQHYGTVRHVAPVGQVATRKAAWPRQAITPRQP